MNKSCSSSDFPWPESLIKEIQLLCAERSVDAYLVGGIVRDALLYPQALGEVSRKKLDIDIVIVGNGIQFAQTLSDRIACKIETFKSFGTARLSELDTKWFGNKASVCDLDIVTARSEIYKSAGAFPSVTPSTLNDDLQRRDFTINTLCLPISQAIGTDWRSNIIDNFNGIRDLELKQICVLHSKSFIDDPTRIFRAARYAARYGFYVCEESRVLIKEALVANCFNTVSKNRIAKEYRLIEQEEAKDQVLSLLEAWGIR